MKYSLSELHVWRRKQISARKRARILPVFVRGWSNVLPSIHKKHFCPLSSYYFLEGNIVKKHMLFLCTCLLFLLIGPGWIFGEEECGDEGGGEEEECPCGACAIADEVNPLYRHFAAVSYCETATSSCLKQAKAFCKMKARQHEPPVDQETMEVFKGDRVPDTCGFLMARQWYCCMQYIPE